MEYTETERRILDMWPKFEDGTYVMLGDKAIANSGENSGKEFTVRNVYFESAHGKLRSSALDGCYWNWKAADPYVKRPAPKVLDADGVPIKVGDTVWHEDGSEQLVEELNRYGARCFDGDKRRTFNPKYLTHTRPDSWERLEEDAESIRQTIARNFGDFSPSDFKQSGDSLQDRVIDLIRRAKAIAKKEAAR